MNLAFDSVGSTDSADKGINLAGPGAGTFTAQGGTSPAPGTAFDFIALLRRNHLPGRLNNGAGNTANVSGRTGGAVTLSGASTKNDAGGGTTVSGNGRLRRRSAAQRRRCTLGGGAGVVMSWSDRHMLYFPGGGLGI